MTERKASKRQLYRAHSLAAKLADLLEKIGRKRLSDQMHNISGRFYGEYLMTARRDAGEK